MKGPYDFLLKEEIYKRYTEEELRYAVQDAAEAAKAMRDHDPVGEAWYLDDMATIVKELRRRGLSV